MAEVQRGSPRGSRFQSMRWIEESGSVFRWRIVVPGLAALVATVCAASTPRAAFAGDTAAASRLPSIRMTAVEPISSEPILPTVVPVVSSARTLHLSAARGEFEPVSFLIRTGASAAASLKLKPSDLTETESGAVVPAANLDIRLVKVWYQAIDAWNDISKRNPADFRQKLVPELLLKDDALVRVDEQEGRNYLRLGAAGTFRYEWVNVPELAPANFEQQSAAAYSLNDSRTLELFDVPANTTRQVWVLVHVPVSATPGVYRGSVELVGPNGIYDSLPVRLKVHAFELEPPGMIYSIYYRAQLDSSGPSVGSEVKSEKQNRLELQDLRDHGVTNPTLYQSASNQVLLAKALRQRELVGANDGQLYYLGIQTREDSLGGPRARALAAIRSKVPVLSRLARRYGYEGIMIYGRDEAKGEALTEQREFWQAVHEYGGGVFVAGYRDAYPLVGDLLDVLVYYGKPDHAEAERWHERGHRVLNYANPQAGPENPYLFRLNYGLILWATRFDGAMPYAYQHCFGSCWNDVDHPTYRDHNLTYPSTEGPIPTLAWEGFREGVDDVRYVRTLEALASIMAAHSPAESKASATYLANLRRDLQQQQLHSGKYNRDVHVDLDAVRDEVVRRISRLREAAADSPGMGQ